MVPGLLVLRHGEKHDRSQNNDTMIRAIFFDLDDTLVDDTISLEQCAETAARELAADRAASPVDLADAYVDAAIDFWTQLGPGSSKPKSGEIRPAMWRCALQRYGIDDDALATRLADRFDALRVERVELFPEALPVLNALHGRYKMAIITNGYAETHELKIARLELERFFDRIILAGDLEMVKPDPAIFAHAMDLLGVSPPESLMVGDRYDRDIEGAHAAGMRAVWIRCRDESVPAGARPPDATISGIGELAGALEAIDARE
jgi:putative hydrolase of the HAD superfamily